MWFTDNSLSAIGRFSTANSSVVEYRLQTVNAEPYDITVGPDGAMWFTEAISNTIGRITTAGALTEYPVPSCSIPMGIAVRQNGTVWVACSGGNALMRFAY